MMQCYHRNGRKQWFLSNVGTSSRYNVCYVILLTQLILSITRGYAIGEFAYFIIHIRCVISSHIFHKQESIMQNFGCFIRKNYIFVSRCLDRSVLKRLLKYNLQILFFIQPIFLVNGVQLINQNLVNHNTYRSTQMHIISHSTHPMRTKWQSFLTYTHRLLTQRRIRSTNVVPYEKELSKNNIQYSASFKL